MYSTADIVGPNDFRHQVSLSIDGVESRFLIEGSYASKGNYKCDIVKVSNGTITPQEFLRNSTAADVNDWRTIDDYWVEAWSCPDATSCGRDISPANFGYQIYYKNIVDQEIYYSCYWSTMADVN